MPHYVAFLRGMNLGGRRITNADLCTAMERIGCKNARAFLASGNVVFESSTKAASLVEKIEQGLRKELGYEVPTFVRSAQELATIANATPFAKRTTEPRGKLQVALLTEAPAPSVLKAAMKLQSADDWLEIRGCEIYWWPIAGVATSALDFKQLEKLVGPTTVRTHNTMSRLNKKHFE